MDEVVKILEEISSSIYHKTLSYQPDDVINYVGQQECRVIYLTETENEGTSPPGKCLQLTKLS